MRRPVYQEVMYSRETFDLPMWLASIIASDVEDKVKHLLPDLIAEAKAAAISTCTNIGVDVNK